MLKGLKPTLWLILLVAALFFVIWIISGSQAFQTCFQEQKHEYNYRALYEDNHVIVKTIVRLRLNGECSLRFFGENSEAITAMATVFIALFTLTLKTSTDKLWDAHEKQLQLSRDEFSATHRSRIFVQFVTRHYPGLTQEERNRVQIHFWIANGGDTNATITRFSAYAYGLAPNAIFEPSLEAPDPQIMRDVVLRPGEGMLVCSSRFTDIGWLIDGYGSRGRTFAIGWVEYTGLDGVPRVTGFCREHIDSTGMWRRVEDSEYEYAY